MKNYIFIRNKNYRPSTYYRIYQYLENKNFDNVVINEYEIDKYYTNKDINRSIATIIYSLIPGYLSRLSELIKISMSKESYNLIIQREVFPRYVGIVGMILLKRMLKRAKRVIWDFDDNIIDNKEISSKEKELLFRYSDKIIVGNEFLKSKCPLEIKDKITIINTTDKMISNINIVNINERRISSFDKKTVLVWLGTKGNLHHLIRIIPTIDKAIDKISNKEIVLKIISDENVNFKTNKLKIENEKWSREGAIESLKYAHIGLMPLEENEFTKGKCAFKAIQYIGVGITPIVSNVGMNYKVVANKNGFLFNNNMELEEAIIKLCSSKENWEKYSVKSRELWEKEFNSKYIESLLLNILYNNEVKKC